MLSEHLTPSVPNQLRLQLDAEGNAGRRLRMIDAALRPREPQLLDTSVLQNLDWVDRQLAASGGAVSWHETAVADLEKRFGRDLATDLLDLGTLYTEFEARGSYPWAICSVALEEASVLQNEKGDRLRDLISFLLGQQDDWDADSFPEVLTSYLLRGTDDCASPLIVRGARVNDVEDLIGEGGLLAFLADHGDRAVVARAILTNIPTIVTTDRRTFWRHRDTIRGFGIDVLRPSELLELYVPYWNALDYETARRRRESDRLR